MSFVKSCPVCAGPVPPAIKGHVRTYCGRPCQQRAEYLLARDRILAQRKAQRARRRQWRKGWAA